ncbi:Protein of unknown function [Filimonas lacunae]|uniref:DUF2851 domain-containing protein n=1 Tax=Filimonas lacunae TaxID=477680 RepID=A0A173ME38_9BACT|nr:DUF2851 family protein [Filimonas lacunae]BAV05749.1 hypothetical protein FLA_1761 [Filimonas lacunae]SIT28724.1 Protein of unknown function [Filimonas lacunae]
MLTHAPHTANIITEKLLQFIWLHRYFNYKSAYTTEGEPIEVIQTGILNVNQGPDFLQARIRIRDKTWAGNVELHIQTTDWDRHRHSPDSHYDNVVLHVVWQHPKPAASLGNRQIPVLELQPLVSTLMLQQYQKLMEAPDLPGCSSLLPVLSDISWTAWKERLAVERLTRKSAEILEFLTASNNHWEEVFWWLLARNFGLKVNATFFETVARSIPVNVLARHKGQINQLECLLLGQANLLSETFTGTYEQMLQKEYRYLKHKYSLPTIKGQVSYLRMRPAAFPTVRLAQLAMLIHKSHHLFSFVRDADSLQQVTCFFDVTANDYWHYHYTMRETAEYLPKKMGKALVNNIVINTVVPILFAYGLHMNDELIKERAVAWLLQTPKEENSIITYWQQQNIEAVNAMDSQALIELKNLYCSKKQCLDCAVGNTLLKNSSS